MLRDRSCFCSLVCSHFHKGKSNKSLELCWQQRKLDILCTLHMSVNYRPTVFFLSISALGGSSALHIPAFPSGGCLIDYVPQVCQLLTNKVNVLGVFILLYTMWSNLFCVNYLLVLMSVYLKQGKIPYSWWTCMCVTGIWIELKALVQQSMCPLRKPCVCMCVNVFMCIHARVSGICRRGRTGQRP